jgi:hypothetical protein
MFSRAIKLSHSARSQTQATNSTVKTVVGFTGLLGALRLVPTPSDALLFVKRQFVWR